jgi:glycosyltransferase involved in cell wall biosynthesis
MNSEDPLVSVVMTSYGDILQRLVRAADSILTQTEPRLELLIAFEPGDPNADLLRQEIANPRLVILRNPKRAGKAGSFNHGLSKARGRYIARMDSDDFAFPDRIRKQLDFLVSHPDISMVGSQVVLIDEEGRPIGERHFGLDHKSIVKNFTFVNDICHSTVLWDRSKVGEDLRYDESFSVEDLELWFRLMLQGHRFANIDEPLIEYKQPIGSYCRPMQNWRGNLWVRANYWRLILRYPTLLVGLLAYTVLSIVPKPVVDRLTGRSAFSDRLRAVRRSDATIAIAPVSYNGWKQ